MTGRANRRRPLACVFRCIAEDGTRREKKRRLERIDAPILTVQGVANLLHCTEAAVRRIPETELNRYKAGGRRILYLPEDVLRYVRDHTRNSPRADELMRDIENEQVESSLDSGRRRRRRNSDA